MESIKLREPLWVVILKVVLGLTFLILGILSFTGTLGAAGYIILGITALVLAIMFVLSIFIKTSTITRKK